MKVDLDGNIVGDTDYTVNPAGFVIHSAVHAARPDAKCVLHTHTVAGMAVASLEEGLLPLTQKSMRFYNRIGYHDYEGVADDLDERTRIVASLGKHNALILRNHGLLTCGPSIPEAFNLIYQLERVLPKPRSTSWRAGASIVDARRRDAGLHRQALPARHPPPLRHPRVARHAASARLRPWQRLAEYDS